jgi:hypothetical protein
MQQASCCPTSAKHYKPLPASVQWKTLRRIYCFVRVGATGQPKVAAPCRCTCCCCPAAAAAFCARQQASVLLTGYSAR